MTHLDASQQYRPADGPAFVNAAIAHCGTQIEVARRLGVTRDYLRKICRGHRRISFGCQVLLEQLAREGLGGVVIDVQEHHSPEAAPALVSQALEASGSLRALSWRAGVTVDYLNKLCGGLRSMSYGLQVVLECIAHERNTMAA